MVEARSKQALAWLQFTVGALLVIWVILCLMLYFTRIGYWGDSILVSGIFTLFVAMFAISMTALDVLITGSGKHLGFLSEWVYQWPMWLQILVATIDVCLLIYVICLIVTSIRTNRKLEKAFQKQQEDGCAEIRKEKESDV